MAKKCKAKLLIADATHKLEWHIETFVNDFLSVNGDKIVGEPEFQILGDGSFNKGIIVMLFEEKEEPKKKEEK